jgi:hypothetical protein
MARKAIHILDKENLAKFKVGALNRAKEFDVTNILSKYEAYYSQVMEKQNALSRG